MQNQTSENMTIKFAMALLFSILFAVFANEDGPEVTIAQGILKGKVQTTGHGREFNSFTGIPYAKPPVGPLRFKAPVLPDTWEGVYDATTSHPVCPQSNILAQNFTVIGDEDCLYLNVYTPQLPDAEKTHLPVMFFIHGGGWQIGSAGSDLYGADLLMEKDIVLVTANYRLGPLGFFTTGNENMPGNNGLKDQSFAIKWIRKNIARFGGDPDQITVFGQSAGGASAHYHMISPLSRKLIKGVMAQSGNALSMWALAPAHAVAKRTKILAGFVKCPTYKNDEMIECLMDVDAHYLIRETQQFLQTDMDPMILFKPVMEPPIKGAFLSDDPLDIIKSGKAANIPFMTGITAQDGAFRTASIFNHPDVIKKLNDDFTETAPLVLMYGESAQIKTKDSITKKIKKFYFEDKTIDNSTKHHFTDMYTDALFLMGADTSVEMHAKYSKQPVYYYLFDYRGSTSFCDLFSQDALYDYGVCHCDELMYLFKNDGYFPKYEPNESDKKVTELMTRLWTNFAKHGNPTPDTDSTISVKWQPAQVGKQNFYHIKSSSELELGEGLYSERAKFWRSHPIDSRRIRIRDEL